ncbi:MULTISPECIES: hypothetical protein [unclassified Paenibacillus]|jgi:hypothetical protein|uniref:hypothetical protein n=1 Tax=unclassified Paenibacillus TaxID=185978 RepID=UPI00096FB160|nr:hypothetical protein [Paenibacillus sp. FSL H7-0331]OMF02624.1 hypothetical protein BK127_37080 [Paenibacillus sp. FSL H7-0331]
MNVLWLLPDDTTLESSVPNIDQLLFILELVNLISIKGISYKSFQSELIVENGQLKLAISLNKRPSSTFA